MHIKRVGRACVGAAFAVLIWQSSVALGGTVAYWRFEAGPADSQVQHGGLPDGVFYPGVVDSSGNGNDLSPWNDLDWAGEAYRTDVGAATILQTGEPNSLSVQNTGCCPGFFTGSEAMRTMTPAQWTIEVSFKPEVGNWRTLVGRDSRGAAFIDTNLAALYFQITDNPRNALAIKFADVSGYWHDATSAPETIKGFQWPDAAAGRWYHAAAVSDGSTLSLYLNDVNEGTGYKLVAQIDMAASGSPNTALTAGLGSGGDWQAGNWTVMRGMYAGGHGDRAYGFIDEVRISDSALDPSQFLHVPPPGSTMTISPDTIDAAPGDPTRTVDLVIPPDCNASQAVDVTVTSDAAGVSKPAGSEGSTVVSYAAGAGATKQLTIEFGTVGQARYTLSATGDCPAGPGAALTVNVHAVEAVEVQVNYGAMTVGGTQQAKAIGSFGAAGTRDISAAAKGTTYSVSPGGVLSISEDGLITALAAGQASVTATNNGIASAPVVITVGEPSAIAIAGPGVLLVDLRASDPSAGSATWQNLGVLDDFNEVGTAEKEVVAGNTAVTFSAQPDAYQGPLAPEALRTGPGRSIEIWVYNPSLDRSPGLESMVAWGHRGGPCGANLNFSFGDHPIWGAVGAWCDPDLGWHDSGGAPPTGEWRHLVYTYSYDAVNNASTTSVYDNGALINSEVIGYRLAVNPGHINLMTQNLSPNPLDFFTADDWGTMSVANVRVHEGTLTADQVLQNYNAGIQMYEFDQMALAPSSLVGTPVDPDAQVALSIPAACNTGQSLAVTITSSNPAVAKPAGAAGASAVVNFAAGGATTQLVAIDLIAPGEANFTLTSDKGCPTGPLSTLQVTVTGPESLELQTTYDVVKVGDTQQARVIASFGAAGTRDVAAAALGTTYSVTPAGVLNVSADGQIEAVALGSATITASYGGLTAERTIKVVTPGHPRIRIAGSGILLVDLSASDATAGQAVWQNKGSLSDFRAIGEPVPGTVANEPAVTFDGNDGYQGPLAPPELLGGQGRTIEIWAFNPSVDQGMETAVAWSHRGGPCGSNMSFGFGNHPTWGAAGQWCDGPDVGWNNAGGSPPVGEWRHLVYTFDPNDNGGTTRLYDAGVQANADSHGPLASHEGYINLMMQNLSANPNNVWMDGEVGSMSLAVVRIHDGALTAEEVAHNFNMGIAGRGLPGDFDADLDVDITDVALFGDCAAGPAIPLAENCQDRDVDGDGDGDQEDFGLIQRCFSGAGVPANPSCAD